MKTSFEEKAILSAHPDFVLGELGGAVFLAHASGQRIVIDRLGKSIWETLPATADGVVTRVRREWNVSSELVRRLLYLFLRAGAITSTAETVLRTDPLG